MKRRDAEEQFESNREHFESNQDQFERNQEQFECNKRDFILTEIDSGLTFAKLALDATDADKRERNLSNARKAYQTANNFLHGKPRLDDQQDTQILGGLNNLKRRLMDLGEEFPD